MTHNTRIIGYFLLPLIGIVAFTLVALLTDSGSYILQTDKSLFRKILWLYEKAGGISTQVILFIGGWFIRYKFNINIIVIGILSMSFYYLALIISPSNIWPISLLVMLYYSLISMLGALFASGHKRYKQANKIESD